MLQGFGVQMRQIKAGLRAPRQSKVNPFARFGELAGAVGRVVMAGSYSFTDILSRWFPAERRQVFGPLVVGGEHGAVGTGRATRDLPPIVAGFSCIILPPPVVGHRAFDAEKALVIVGDDEEKLFGRSSVGRGRSHNFQM